MTPSTPPKCAGTYEAGHPMCDGTPNGATWEERAICAWRDRCVGLKAFCQEHNYAATNVAVALGDGLVALCDTQVDKLGIKDGRVTKGVPQPASQPASQPQPESPAAPATLPEVAATTTVSKPEVTLEKALEEAKAAVERGRNPLSRRQRLKRGFVAVEQPAPSVGAAAPVEVARTEPEPKSGTTSKKRAQRINPTELVSSFEDGLRQVFADYTFGLPKRVVVRPGTLYAVDRTIGSRYVRWYCAAGKGRDRAVACLRLKERSGTIDVALPASREQLEAVMTVDDVKALEPASIHDGQFRTLCRGLVKAELDLVIRTLRALTDSGVLHFPKEK